MPTARRLVVGLLVAAVTTVSALVGAPAASAGGSTATTAPRTAWTGTNPYVFAVGDSIVQQCGETFGMGWRALGMLGWPGADSGMVKERLTSKKEGYPFTTEKSNAKERTWFRDAGSLVIGLGTNDVKVLTVAQWRANIDWFMTQSRGRPVEWFTIHNPPYKKRQNAFNAELRAATGRWPNLQLLDWDRFVKENPSVTLKDEVHVATAAFGCAQGRNRLIQAGAPDVPGKTPPRGYWYVDPTRKGTVKINGWGVPNTPSAKLWVNVRSDFAHVGRWAVTARSSDLWATAASGREFNRALGKKYRGHTICVDLVDAADRWTSLGCRRV